MFFEPFAYRVRTEESLERHLAAVVDAGTVSNMTLVEFRQTRSIVEQPSQERTVPAVLDTPEDVAQTVREFQAAYADAGSEGLAKAWQARIDATTERTLSDAHTPLD